MTTPPTVSTSSTGEEFPLPIEAGYQVENDCLSTLVAEHKKLGHEIVVVMGVGFVGAVMAGVVADTLDPETGKPGKFVIGMQERPLNDLNASCKKIV